jgi:integrase
VARARNAENRGLPARWKFYHGAYYFQVPPGQEPAWDNKKTFRLGGTLPEAYKEWAKRIEATFNATTIGALLERYQLEVIPTKAPSTQRQNLIALKQLRLVFADMNLDDIIPRHVYLYVDKRSAKTSAHREVEVLSHAYTKAVEWGYIDRHPFLGQVALKGEKPRTRYIEDWEIIEMLALTPRRQTGSILAVHAYIQVKLLTGMRRGDLLRLTMPDLMDDGIHVTPHKTAGTTGKQLIIRWSTDLQRAVRHAKDARPVKLSPFLFCNRRGEGYIDELTGRAASWDSMWTGFVERVLAETKVKERFTEHDLRAKCASDAATLEHAQALLGHASSSLTDRVYRRKAQYVMPLR